MPRKLVALALVAGSMTLACTESVGPPLDLTETEPGIVESLVFHPIKWKPMDGPLQFTAGVVLDDDDDRFDDDDNDLQLSPSAGPPILDDYAVSFWAVKGETRGVRINWLEVVNVNGQDTTISHPYIDFVVPEEGLLEAPNGDPYSEGDSVLITVTVDTTEMVTEFGPSGLTFDQANPAVLQYWYTGSGGDLNDDGVVDQDDADIEATLLDLWESPGSSSTWSPIWADHSLAEDWFKAGVGHFSGFAVAY